MRSILGRKRIANTYGIYASAEPQNEGVPGRTFKKLNEKELWKSMNNFDVVAAQVAGNYKKNVMMSDLEIQEICVKTMYMVKMLLEYISVVKKCFIEKYL
ncbi:unnamed protein product [Owenia fusiformis]|uniref:Uncharacterized protein n=1 Tax=Owenia fusiformis TaxID=6347 RepID=A0A8S4Q4P6_OWEFU|nr:unnamed protein product [Owenia fusiformis]